MKKDTNRHAQERQDSRTENEKGKAPKSKDNAESGRAGAPPKGEETNLNQSGVQEGSKGNI